MINDYVCFDLETTGFGNYAEIIEFGAVKVRNGSIADTFSELVKPVQKVMPRITALTGITQRDVQNCRSIAEVLPDFLEFIGNDILVGHNIASFDIPIIRRVSMEISGKRFDARYIDTMHLSRKIRDVPNHKLQTMLDYYGINNARAHRAYEDCEATHKLFQALAAGGITAVPR